MKKHFVHLILLVSFGCTWSQGWTEVQKIVASDRSSEDYFGFSVVIKSNEILVGAYENNPGGRVYVFKNINDNWSESYSIEASDVSSFQEFGRRIILENSTLVVSDPAKSNGSEFNIGQVYIFEKDGDDLWKETQIIQANNPVNYGRFGLETGMDNEYLAIATSVGNVNLFKKNNGTGLFEFISEITTSDGVTFLSSVDIDENILAVGNYEYDEAGIQNSGAVYMFQKDASSEDWAEFQKITLPNPTENDKFGKRVFFHNDFLFIASVNKRSVYIYKLNSTTGLYDYLSTLAGESGFGQEISAEGNSLFIGAYRASYDENNENYVPSAGAIYMYQFNQDMGLWEFENKITHSDRDNINWLGSSLSIDNGLLVSGAPYQDTDANSENELEKAGATYVFEVDNLLSSNSVNRNLVIIYPNPIKSELNIEYPDQILQVEVFDLNGKHIIQFYKNFNSINLENIPDGIYMIKITDNYGRQIFKKIIKKADL